MRAWMKSVSLSCSAVIVGMFVSNAAADPLDLTHVPADSRWLVHVDMDTACKSSAWKEIYSRLQQRPDFQAKVAELEGIFKARFPEDLHDVTVFGSKFGDKEAVVLVHATVDRRQVETLLSASASYNSTPHGDHSVLTWDDRGETKYGGFFSDSLFVVADNQDRVGATFDVLDAKAASLKSDATLAKGSQAGVMVYVAGDEIAKLRQGNKAHSPLLGQMKAAWFSISEEKEDTLVRVNVDANDAATATKMQQAAEGMRAMLNLAAGADDAKPIVQKLSDLVTQATVVVKESSVSVECHVPNKQIPALLDEAMAAGEAAKKQ